MSSPNAPAHRKTPRRTRRVFVALFALALCAALDKLAAQLGAMAVPHPG